MDAKDKLLLDLLQNNFLPAEKPYLELGKQAGISEGAVLSRLKRLKKDKYIRFVGAFINTKALGFKSQLTAFHVEKKNISRVAKIINSHPGVSHNYVRDNYYNVWFTIAVPPTQSLAKTMKILFKKTGVKEYLELPSLKVYKLRFVLDLTDKIKLNNKANPSGSLIGKKVALSKQEKEILNIIQNSLEVTKEPFKEIALHLNITTKKLLEKIKALTKKKIIRRWGGVVSHARVGFKYNVMVVWKVPKARADYVGRKMAKYPFISHCYKRPVSLAWQYPLYTMIHSKSKNQANTFIKQIAKEFNIKDYLCLVTKKELKKKRLKYFTDEFNKWIGDWGQTLSSGV